MDQLELLIVERALHERESRIKEREVKERKENEKRVNEREMQKREMMVNEGTTLDDSLEKGRYGVSKVFDTAYWGFLEVGTMFDIFHKILFPYGLNTAYWYFLDTAYWILFPSWSLVKCRHIYAVSSLMDTAYWLSEQNEDGITRPPFEIKSSQGKTIRALMDPPSPGSGSATMGGSVGGAGQNLEFVIL
ncbi:hypothetical protein Tco_1042264 [Tanacetum coccineum]|uniref:Uncharacterized protein n=1 Tax=Tanacetum coccineum TaxID=301880 RepID=A0ABQ5GJR2_9ASTR